MRGKQSEDMGGCGGDGLIPAHAGKTSVIFFSFYGSAAHPRSCGENRPLMRSTLMFSGSSPLMRGKLLALLPSVSMRGLIPAHAGKTMCIAVGPALGRAHPRSCGENPVGGAFPDR